MRKPGDRLQDGAKHCLRCFETIQLTGWRANMVGLEHYTQAGWMLRLVFLDPVTRRSCRQCVEAVIMLWMSLLVA